jgi:hypothetical protein
VITEESLRRVFVKFCAGAKQHASGASEAAMDNPKFAKLCRDAQLVGRSLTASDVDLIFAKAKPPGERRLTFEHFKVALALIAEKKYSDKDPATAERMLLELVCSCEGPSLHGTHAKTDAGIFDRLTDASQYTGSHKNRFDETGRGLGAAGRDTGGKGGGAAGVPYRGGPVHDLSQLLWRK